MNYIFDNKQSLSSNFVQEDYFSVIVRFSSEELENNFIEFSYGKTDMFEFQVDKRTSQINNFVLTLCNHFNILEENIQTPKFEDGVIRILGPEKTECDCFSANIYLDGLRIDLNQKEAVTQLKSGQLGFSFDENNELCSLYVLDLTRDEIEHVVSELNCN